jgi:phenylacetic acid degradation operon negative regulatory protein
MTQERNAQSANALTPRSLMLSLLLGMRRPRRPASQLVAWCGLFGVPAGTARVALSRMVEAGELVNDDGVYELAGRVRARGGEQSFALTPAFRDGDGDGAWWLYLVVAETRSRADRAALREAFRRAHFAERREGAWLRPANLATRAPSIVTEQCEEYSVRPETPRSLAEELFAPVEWATIARALAGELRTANRGLAFAGGLPNAFVVGTRAVAHLRADPLLPPELLPARWPGDRLRAAYLDYRDVFSRAVRDWFDAL